MGKKIEFTKYEIDMIKSLYQSGINQKNIGRVFGVSESKIGRVLKTEGVQAKSSKDYCSILNHEDEINVIEQYTGGKNMKEIARMYNCSSSVIDDVLRRNGIKKKSFSEAFRKYNIDDYYFDEINNQDKAYMLGFFYADAYNISSYDKHLYNISLLLQPCDKYMLERMRENMGMEREVKTIINSTNKKPYVKIEIMNKHMVLRLDELGIVRNKTRKTAFPFYLSKELYSHFVRGLLDGDGCIVHSLNRVTMVGSKQLMNDLANVIEEYVGFRQHVGEYKISPGICYMHISAKWKIEAFLDWVYKDADMKLLRKYELYLRIKEKNKMAS